MPDRVSLRARVIGALPDAAVSLLRRNRRPLANLVYRAFRTFNTSDSTETYEGRVAFLIGAARSGTTLLYEVIRAGEEIDAYNEPKHGFAARHGIPAFDRKFMGLTSPSALRKEALAARKPHLGPDRTYIEKWPNNVYLIQELADVFPRAKFINIVRDGRAVAESARQRYEGEWLTGRLNVFTSLTMNRYGFDNRLHPIGRAALRWRLNVEEAERLLSGLAAERVHVIRYETLTSEPDRAVPELFAFLGERYEPARLPRFKSPRPPVWHEWAPEERQAFNEIAGDLLIRLGYAESNDW